jgi:hypothetical protein
VERPFPANVIPSSQMTTTRRISTNARQEGAGRAQFPLRGRAAIYAGMRQAIALPAA